MSVAEDGVVDRRGPCLAGLQLLQLVGLEDGLELAGEGGGDEHGQVGGGGGGRGGELDGLEVLSGLDLGQLGLLEVDELALSLGLQLLELDAVALPRGPVLVDALADVPLLLLLALPVPLDDLLVLRLVLLHPEPRLLVQKVPAQLQVYQLLHLLQVVVVLPQRREVVPLLVVRVQRSPSHISVNHLSLGHGHIFKTGATRTWFCFVAIKLRERGGASNISFELETKRIPCNFYKWRLNLVGHE